MNYKIKNDADSNYVCKKKPKYIYNNVERIIVIGDLHGDFQILIRCLKLANVINNKLQWIGKKTHVVQLGDILDAGGRGAHYKSDPYEEFNIYEYLNILNIEANKTGGFVHFLIGNHELMNLVGDFSYVHKDHLLSNRKEIFKPGSYFMQMLACQSYGVLNINGWIFSHAGILPQHLKTHTLDSINMLVKEILLGRKTIGNLTSTEWFLIFSEQSPFWNREYISDNNRCNVLQKTLDKLGNAKGMVIGHTPHSNIQGNCDNKLWYADLGLSKAFGNKTFNNVQVLEIVNNTQTILKE